MTYTEKTLEQFGLSVNETKVYLAILENGEQTPFQIAKITGIPRTSVYDIVMSLSLKKLVELKQSNGFSKQQTLISAKNPSILRKILQEKRKDLIKLELNVMNILPDIKRKFHKDDANAFIKFYPGIDGAKIVAESQIHNIDLTAYCWSDLTPMDVFGNDELNDLIGQEAKTQKSKKGEIRIIIPLNDWTKHVTSYQYSRDKNYLKTYNFRFIDQPGFDILQEISVQGNSIKILSARDDENWGATIVSNMLAQTLTAMHQYMWLTAQSLTADIVESWGENEMFQAEKGNV